MTRAYKPWAYLRVVEVLRLRAGEVILAAAHNDDLNAPRAAGLATGFILRPKEHGGPGQRTDLAPSSDWDALAGSISALAHQLGCEPGGH